MKTGKGALSWKEDATPPGLCFAASLTSSWDLGRAARKAFSSRSVRLAMRSGAMGLEVAVLLMDLPAGIQKMSFPIELSPNWPTLLRLLVRVGGHLPLEEVSAPEEPGAEHQR